MFFNNFNGIKHITVNDLNVKVVEEVSFLGLTLTNDLKWKTHMDKVVKKINSGIFSLTQTSQVLNRSEIFLRTIHMSIHTSPMVT